MQWVSSGDSRYTPTSPPKQVVPANGGTDRIVFQNSNIEIHPTWLVVGTEYTVEPAVGVPDAGPNEILRTSAEISPGSPVGPTTCQIGHGWDPDAQIVFSNVN